jgi:hypothetical protein
MSADESIEKSIARAGVEFNSRHSSWSASSDAINAFAPDNAAYVFS